MWTDSKKWKEMRANGGHGVVRFDVFCCQCQKQLAEDVEAGTLRQYGIRTDQPMGIFCGIPCMEVYQEQTGKRLGRYGWRPLLGW